MMAKVRRRATSRLASAGEKAISDMESEGAGRLHETAEPATTRSESAPPRDTNDGLSPAPAPCSLPPRSPLMSLLIVLAALIFLMVVAYRGSSVILFAPLAALGAVLLT